MQKSMITSLLFNSIMIAALWAPVYSHAQRTQYEIARDTITQWIYHNNVIKKKTYKPVKLPDGRMYTVWQQTLTDSLQRWVQASYFPRAGALDIRYNKYQDFQHDKEAMGPLHRYGISYHIYPVSYSKSARKLDVGGEAFNILSIYANGPIGKYVKMFSGKGRNWYITSPPLDVKAAPAINDDDGFLNNLKNYPAIAPYLQFHKQHSGMHNIILAQNNQLPFIKVTVNEYLQAYEEYTKSRLNPSDANYNASPLFASIVNEELNKIPLIRERLKERLSEPAKFRSDDGYYDPADICNGKNCGGETFEMYQFSAETIALMKKDKPLWVNITLAWLPERLHLINAYQSVCTNFNFNYLYNYCFEPDKIKNTVYAPLYAPMKILPPKRYASERSAVVKKAKENTSVLFFDDFSGNTIGAEPVGWFSKLGAGSLSSKLCTVRKLENEKGLWLNLYPGHVALCNDINMPLPPDFTVSYDISCTDNNLRTSSGVYFFLTDLKDNDELLYASFGVNNLGRNANTTLMLKTLPAVNNNEGVEISFSKPVTGSKHSGIKYYNRKIASFTGKRALTKATIVIQVKGAALNISINGEPVLNENNIIPAGVNFSTMSWGAAGGALEASDVTNIKITKD